MVGALTTIAAFVNDAYELANAGLPNMVWAAVGAAVFFVSVVSILFRQQQRIDSWVSNNAQLTANANKEQQIHASGFSFEEPNYDAWDQSKALSIITAASLFADCDPVDHPTAMEVMTNIKPWYRMLTEAIKNGELNAYIRYKHGAEITTRAPEFGHVVKRDELVAFAEKRGLRPKFLFPEERD